MGRLVNQAIDDFNRASQEPQFIGNVDYVGDDVIGYAARNSVIDDWVGKVGQAFIQADHKGVPPQLYKGNQEDFITGPNTASEADLAQLVGDDPVTQADDAAKGATLAAQLKLAEDAEDEGRLRAILLQLQGQSQEFAYGFFNELGPDQTIKTLIVINQLQDDGLLQTFDNALGQATQHPLWDPSFTSALLDSHRDAWGDGRTNTGVIQLSMLKYGTFSEDFLTQSADYFLFSGKTPNIMANDKGLVVFNALDRNPNAAYDYLTGHLQLGDENLSRVQYLLRHSNMDANNPGENTALGNLIADAGLSDNGLFDNGNQLLQDIGSIDTQGEVPNEVRPGIERLLVHYMGNFYTTSTPSKNRPESSYTWQERLFVIAQMNVDGSVDQGRMTEVQRAAMKSLFEANPPPQDPDKLTAWARDMGRKTHDLIQPLITWQRAYDDSQAAAKTLFINLITGAATSALAAIPFVDAVTPVVAGSVFTTYVWVAPSKTESDEDAMEKTQENTVKVMMVIDLARHGMLHPPVNLSDPNSIGGAMQHPEGYHVTLPDGSSKSLADVTAGAGDQYSQSPNH
ncbi:MAG: hypothetical protein ACRDTX_22740 [Pseudonocardiaceae bacterium]